MLRLHRLKLIYVQANLIVWIVTASVGFQEVYGKLEEPDGLSGMVQLRSGGPRLKDQVRDPPARKFMHFDAFALHQATYMGTLPAA